MLEIFVIQHTSIWLTFILTVLYFRFKRNMHKCNFYYVAIPLMTSQILKSVDFTKTQNLDILRTKDNFFFKLKKFINYTSKATLRTIYIWRPWKLSTFQDLPASLVRLRPKYFHPLNLGHPVLKEPQQIYHTCERTKSKQKQNQVMSH